jgi:hypothetical protein
MSPELALALVLSAPANQPARSVANDAVSFIIPAPKTAAAPKSTLYFCHTDPCPWCEKLESAMQTPAVSAALSRYNIVHLRTGEDDAKIAELGITGFPTLVLVSPDGKVRDRIVGFLDPGPLAARLQAKVQQAAICPHCAGRGVMPDASKDYGWTTCLVCAGTGKVPPIAAKAKAAVPVRTLFNVPGGWHVHACPFCQNEWAHRDDGNKGRVGPHTCPSCRHVLPSPWIPARHGPTQMMHDVYPAQVSSGSWNRGTPQTTVAYCPPGQT